MIRPIDSMGKKGESVEAPYLVHCFAPSPQTLLPQGVNRERCGGGLELGEGVRGCVILGNNVTITWIFRNYGTRYKEKTFYDCFVHITILVCVYTHNFLHLLELNFTLVCLIF